MGDLLRLDDCTVSFDTPQGTVEAVRGVSFSLKEGEVLAVVGESGCGKSVLCQSMIKILPRNARTSGALFAGGVDISGYTEKQIQKLRGPFFSMLFQDPMTALNPVIPIGKQITEAVLRHHRIGREEAQKKAISMLELVGIDDPIHRYALQPHFFSGGMRQRCVLAIAMALKPKVLLADEPTTALDVTVQARMLDILNELKVKEGLSIIFISHDLGVVARIADRVAVMYAGRLVEIGMVDEIFFDPRHPYTWGLLSSMPSVAGETGELEGIPGLPPSLINPPPGDAFATRNKYAVAIDYEEAPPMFKVSDTHYAATWLLDPRAERQEPPIRLKRRTIA